MTPIAPAQARSVDADTERAARAFLKRLEGKYAIVDAILYGSRARGDHMADSDADIAVVFPGARGDRFELARAFGAIEFDVLMATGVMVQGFPLWEEELTRPETFANPALIDNLIREGVPCDTRANGSILSSQVGNGAFRGEAVVAGEGRGRRLQSRLLRVFDAARAALFALRVEGMVAPIKTHNGLLAKFGQEVILKGRLATTFGEDFNAVQRFRQIADYSGDLVTDDKAAWAVERAEAFVAGVRAMIGS